MPKSWARMQCSALCKDRDTSSSRPAAPAPLPAPRRALVREFGITASPALLQPKRGCFSKRNWKTVSMATRPCDRLEREIPQTKVIAAAGERDHLRQRKPHPVPGRWSRPTATHDRAATGTDRRRAARTSPRPTRTLRRSRRRGEASARARRTPALKSSSTRLRLFYSPTLTETRAFHSCSLAFRPV